MFQLELYTGRQISISLNEAQLNHHRDIPSRASSAFTYPLFGPLFRRTSSYALNRSQSLYLCYNPSPSPSLLGRAQPHHSCPSLEQVPQLGFIPSHRNFRFLHTTQAIRFGLGTSEAPSPEPLPEAFCWLGEDEAVDVDISTSARPNN